MVYRNLRQAHLQEVGLTKISGDREFFNIYSNRIGFGTECAADSRTDSRTNSRTDKHHQIILLNWPSLRHIILNQILPSFSANKVCNGPATWSILTSHYAWGPVTTYNGFSPTHMVRPLDYSQGSSPLQGHGSWLMCEVVLSDGNHVNYTCHWPLHTSKKNLYDSYAWSCACFKCNLKVIQDADNV
jgi:hypothetical protein